MGDEITPRDANHNKTDHNGPASVGSYRPNAYGLHDMIGNVREWVGDYYSDDYFLNSPKENPQGPEEGHWRVIKGGG